MRNRPLKFWVEHLKVPLLATVFLQTRFHKMSKFWSCSTFMRNVQVAYTCTFSIVPCIVIIALAKWTLAKFICAYSNHVPLQQVFLVICVAFICMSSYISNVLTILKPFFFVLLCLTFAVMFSSKTEPGRGADVLHCRTAESLWVFKCILCSV